MLVPWPGLWKDCSAPGGKLNPRPSWRVRIKIPGLTSCVGGEIRASEAAMFCASLPLLLVLCWRFEVGAGMLGVEVPEGDLAEASVVMVDWEEEREKVLASGARCVSFNSVVCQRQGVVFDVTVAVWAWVGEGGIGGDVLLVSFHDIAIVSCEEVALGMGRWEGRKMRKEGLRLALEVRNGVARLGGERRNLGAEKGSEVEWDKKADTHTRG
jgi:hypothetical protein